MAETTKRGRVADKTIYVADETHARLEELGLKNETFNQIIARLTEAEFRDVPEPERGRVKAIITALDRPLIQMKVSHTLFQAVSKIMAAMNYRARAPPLSCTSARRPGSPTTSREWRRS